MDDVSVGVMVSYKEGEPDLKVRQYEKEKVYFINKAFALSAYYYTC